MRRSYGSGSLIQRGNKWYGQWWVANRRIQRVVGPIREPGSKDGLTKSMAEKRLRQLMGEEIAPLAERITVAEAGKKMIRHAEELGRKKSTIQSYESFLGIHLEPFFKEKPLAKISKDDVEAFIVHCSKKGCATKSTRNYLGLLHSIFDYAIKQEWIASNPVKLIDKPQPKRSSDIRFLDQAELDALLRATRDDDVGRVERVMYLTAAMTGLRQGELIGLRWMDIDWSARKIRVRQSYVRGELTTPKSWRSSRSVPLSDALGGALERLSQESPYDGLEDLVFAHPHTGKPMDRSRLLKRYKAALKRAGVRPARFHDLRHTFGTRMAANPNVSLRQLQEWMGHRDIKTTQIYADYAPSHGEADLVDQAFAASKFASKLRTIGTNSEQEIPANPGFEDPRQP